MKKKVISPIKYSTKDVEFISTETLYQGFTTVKKVVFSHRLFDGTMSAHLRREVIERKNAVILLAYDPKQDQVVLIEQVRISGYKSGLSPWKIELVAGLLDKEGEDEEETARREAMEEAGMEIGRCRRVFRYAPSTGSSTECLTFFVGEVDSSKVSGVYGLDEEGENIRTHVVSRETAYQWIEDGIIDNAGAIIGLQWLQLNYLTLQREWL